MRAGIIACLTLSWISLISACSTRQVLPPEGPTIREIYDAHASRASSEALVQPAPLAYRVDTKPTSVTTTERRFARLYNPTLHLYVYPHLAANERVPVPGYYTVFPLYERIEYALPGEPVDP